MTALDYQAKVLADSLTPDGHRLTSLEVTYPRFVHSELMTHRWFSRNAASSRAIPVHKSIDKVERLPAYPVHWGGEKPGMQPGEELTGKPLSLAQTEWKHAREDALSHARRLAEIGLHKSLVNRIIEPWSWITVIISSTDWDNFFDQRASSRTQLAQPELATAADFIETAIGKSRPELLLPGQWHMPYIGPEDWEKAAEAQPQGDREEIVNMLLRVSVARCARISYLTQDGLRDLQEDLTLYHRLVSAKPMHASPLEHVAHPDDTNVQTVHVVDFRWNDVGRIVGTRKLPLLGNFTGYRQLRHMVEETGHAG